MSPWARRLVAVGGVAVAMLAGCGGRAAPSTPQPAPQRSGSSVATPVAATRAPGEQALLTGTIHTTDHKPLLSAAIIMVPAEDEDAGSEAAEDVRIQPDGTFLFRNVRPGRYQIRARGEIDAQGVSHLGTYNVIVDDRDLRDLDVPLLPGADVRGTLVMRTDRSPKPEALPGVRVRAPFKDGSSFGDTVTGDVGRNGVFRIRGALGGAHVVTVEGLPAPWVLERVTYRGDDITDAGLDLRIGERIDDVTVTITDVATMVEGTVRDLSGAPAADARVVIAPLTPQPWPRTSRSVAVVPADTTGRYRVRGLPPGLYRAAASRDLEARDGYRQDLLRTVREIGLPVALDPNHPSVLDLALTAGATLRRTSVR